MNTPSTNIIPGLNGIWGNPAAIFVGKFNVTADCVTAASAFGYPTGDRLYSFTHHLPNFPDTDWATKCFGLADHTWKPVPDASEPPIIASGRLSWIEPACGGEDAAAGCTWQLDPQCLDDANLLSKTTLSTAEATKACASDPRCVAFSLVNTTDIKNASSTDPVEHSFYSAASGHAGGCWARRKHFGYLGQPDPFRTSYHWQPSQHWMNDPNGPMYANGLYHLMYQFNPYSNEGFAHMHWGHAASADLVRWTELPVALAPDVGNECGGCNSYFGQAEPLEPGEPLLTNWTKPSYNPTATKPPYVPGGFRDPSTAWQGADGVWRQVAACTGGACLFNSTDFMKWAPAGYAVYGYGPLPPVETLSPFTGTAVLPGHRTSLTPTSSGREAAVVRPPMAAVDGPPTWECPDLFSMPAASRAPSALRDSPLWVFKASGALTPGANGSGTDYWSTGSFDEKSGRFVPGAGSQAVPSDSQRCDYGIFYASKSFFDPLSGEQLLIGWVQEEAAGSPVLEWASVQSTPRLIQEDARLPGRLVFPPTPAVRTLRQLPPITLPPTSLAPNASLPLPTLTGTPRLDLTLTLAPPYSLGAAAGLRLLGGALNVSLAFVGPAACANITNGSATCATLSIGLRSGPLVVDDDGPLELRVLTDASIVEAFAAGGRAVVTRRAYPLAGADQLTASVASFGTVPVQMARFEAYSLAVQAPLAMEELAAIGRARMAAAEAQGGMHFSV